jgi:tetratricopeptide (TPR) repeat protein
MERNSVNNLIRAVTGGLMILLLLLAGCDSNPALRQRYNAEKILHQTEKLRENAWLVPGTIPSETRKEIADGYGEVLEIAYGALSTLDSARAGAIYTELGSIAFQASTRLSQEYYGVRRFDTSIAILGRLLTDAPLADWQQLETLINYGKALQANGDFEHAVQIYDRATTRFYPPIDPNGELNFRLFQLPMQIYQIFRQVGDDEAAIARFDQAVEYYTQIANRLPGSDPGNAARVALSQLHRGRRNYTEALAQLVHVRDSVGQIPLAVELQRSEVYRIGLKQYDSAQAILDRLTARPANEDEKIAENTAAELLYRRAVIEMDKEDYAQARALLIQFKNDFPRHFANRPVVQFGIAQTWDREGRWSRAEIEYNYLIDRFGGSEQALSTYLYLASYYDKEDREAEAEAWYRRAEETYRQLAVRGAGSELESVALSYHADLYERFDKWTEAAEILTRLFERHPYTAAGQRGALRAAAIYRQKLDDPALADSLEQAYRSAATEPTENWDFEN